MSTVLKRLSRNSSSESDSGYLPPIPLITMSSFMMVRGNTLRDIRRFSMVGCFEGAVVSRKVDWLTSNWLGFGDRRQTIPEQDGDSTKFASRVGRGLLKFANPNHCEGIK